MVRASSCLLLAWLLLAQSTASASPPDTLGLGARSTSLGGAVTADVGDTSANYYNPAGLARAEGLRIGVNYLSLSNNLDVSGVEAELGRIGATQLGLIAPIDIGQTRLAFGLAFHLDDRLISRIRTPERDRPRWDLYDDRAHKIFLGINVAFQPVRWLRFGMGMSLQSPSDLTLSLSGELGFLNPEQNARLNHTAGGSLISTRALTAGVQVDPIEQLSFGIAYRGSLNLYSRINAIVATQITGIGDPIPLDITIDTRSSTMFVPQQLVLSGAVRPLPSLRFSFDLTWADWSRHPGAGARETITVAVVPPPGIPIEVPEEIPSKVPVSLGLRDTWSPRFGVEGRALSNDDLDVFVRGGYAYVPTGYPTQRGVTNLIDADRHILTLGLGTTFRNLRPTIPGTLSLDAYGMLTFLPTRSHIKDSPIDPVGDYTAGGWQGGFGLSVELAFE